MKIKGINTGLVSVIASTGITASLIACSGRQVQFTTAPAEQGNIEITVMATGYVQPVDKVDVGTQVSGVIEEIYVDYNSVVKKGDLLAELDKSTLVERVTQAKASLVSAQSDLNYAQQSYNRTEQLHNAKAATQVAMEEAINKLAQAQTSVANAKANLHQAEVNLSYASIFSPINGVVLDRTVAVGQTVAASFNTPTLFTIAEDLTKMQVEADVDEADIGRVKVGQKVTFTVDAFNQDVFEGTVSQIRLQPTVTNNVVTYTVIVEAPNPDEKLFPGMTANITIISQSETGLVIPVSALSFRMSDEVAGKLEMTGRQPVAAPSRGQSSQQVWVNSGEDIQPRQIETGINDGVSVIVTSGLSEGEKVVLSATLSGKKTNNGAAASNPLMPRPPGRR